jgi:hypothetical protein
MYMRSEAGDVTKLPAQTKELLRKSLLWIKQSEPYVLEFRVSEVSNGDKPHIILWER